MDKQNLVYINMYNRILFNLKGKEILTDTINITWMTLEDIISSEISQSQKGKYCMLPFT